MQVLVGMSRVNDLLINREDLVAVSESGLGCSVSKTIKLRTWRRNGKASSRFWIPKFQLRISSYSGCCLRTLSEAVMKEKELKES